LVARYHRKSTPKKTHREFISLDKRDRVAVNKMASILRLAIGLSAYNIDTEDIRFELVESDLKIKLDTDSAIKTTHSLAGSESMLEEVFCISVKEGN
jgi:exopolyphosphatase / guanosine-5'-triphosphate,3'-diphosphate pyrophosphatase